MLNKSRFALNRMVCPGLGLERFFRLAKELGLDKVELRNDLAGGKILDTVTRLHFSTPAARSASSKLCSLFRWQPTPLLKNMRCGTSRSNAIPPKNAFKKRKR